MTASTSIQLESLVLSQDFAVPTKKESLFVPIRKPGKQTWFMFNDKPEFRMQVSILEVSEDKENFIVAPALREEMIGEWCGKILTICRSKQGTFFLWPVKLNDSEGRLDNWNQSAIDIISKYPNEWLRLCSNRESGSYEIMRPISEFEPPTWPDDPKKIFETAFKGRVLDSMDHPVIRRLRGAA